MTTPASPLSIAVFPNKLATEPQPKQFESFGGLASWLSAALVAESKDAVPLWSPVTYAPGTTRSTRTQDAIVSVNAGVLEVDHLPLKEMEPLIDRLESTGLELVVYSTHSHRSCSQAKCKGLDDAHLRIVLPFSQPVPVALWPRVWPALVAIYVPKADQAAKDAKRMFYVHSYPASRADLAVFRHLNPAKEVGHAA